VLLSVVLTGRNPTTRDLQAGGRTIGWIRTGSVGFDGFADREGAQKASRVAVDVLEAWYAAREQPIGQDWSALRADSTRDEDLLRVRDVIVGRLVSNEIASKEHDGAHGFELFVPPSTWLAVMLQLAQRIQIEVSQLQLAQPATDEPGEQLEAAVLAGHGA